MPSVKELITCLNPLCRKGAGAAPAQFLRETGIRGRKQLYCSDTCGKQARYYKDKLRNPQPSRVRSAPSNNSQLPDTPEAFIHLSPDQFFNYINNKQIKGSMATRMFDIWWRQQAAKIQAAQPQEEPMKIDWSTAPKEVQEALAIIARWLAAVTA